MSPKNGGDTHAFQISASTWKAEMLLEVVRKKEILLKRVSKRVVMGSRVYCCEFRRSLRESSGPSGSYETVQDGARVSDQSSCMHSADGTGGRGGCSTSKMCLSPCLDSKHMTWNSMNRALPGSDRVESVIRKEYKKWECCHKEKEKNEGVRCYSGKSSAPPFVTGATGALMRPKFLLLGRKLRCILRS